MSRVSPPERKSTNPPAPSEHRSVFVSYARIDRELAETVADMLTAAGHRVATELISNDDHLIGSEYVEVIDRAISSSDVVIALVSNSYVENEFNRSDWLAVTAGRERRVLPVKVDDVDIFSHIGPFVYIDLTLDITRGLSQLQSAVSGRSINRGTRKRHTFEELKKLDLVAGSHSESSRRLPRKKSIWNIPSSRTQDTPRREDLVERLYLEAVSSPSVVTQFIVGLDGTGKSRLAAEYAHRHKDDYDVLWWIPSRAQSKISDGLRELASKLNLDAREANWLSVSKSIQNWCGETNDRWLLIFDDLEDVRIVEEFSQVHSRNRGHVLVTSRHEPRRPVSTSFLIDQLGFEKATQFLLERTGSNSAADARQVASLLDRFTLSLEHAAAYIHFRRLSLASYLSLLKPYTAKIRAEASSPTSESSQPSRQERLSRSLYAPLLLSFWAARDADEDAFALLELLSILDSVPVNLEVLRTLNRRGKNTDDAIRSLTRLALVQLSADGTISMHPVVHETVRKIVPPEAKKEIIKTVLPSLAVLMPSDAGDWQNWKQSNDIAPHLLAILRASQVVNGSLHPQDARPLWQVARYVRARGDVQSATRILTEAGHLLLANDGSENQNELTVSVLNDLAVSLAESGDWRRSIQLQSDLIARCRALPATANLSWLAILINNLASALADSGREKDALTELTELLRQSRNTLVDNRPTTIGLIAAHHNFATIAIDEGDSGDAINHFSIARQLAEASYGEASLEAAEPTIGLAACYISTGRFNDAHRTLDEVVRVSGAVLGAYHPITLAALDQMAALGAATGDYALALICAERSYSRRVDSLGENHPSTLSALHFFARLVISSGDLESGVKMLQDLVDRSTLTLGERHPNTIGAARLLAETERQNGGSSISVDFDGIKSESTEADPQSELRRRTLFDDE